MKRFVLILLLAFICQIPLAASQTGCAAQDTLSLYTSVTDYFETISVLPVDSIIRRCDVLISSVPDRKTQSQIAGLAFDFYAHSPVMGVEGVSVYIADNYFLNKRLDWSDEDSYPMLYTFAEFNRNSLLGMRMSPLKAETLEGGTVDLCAATGGCKILYFYEDRCSACAKETPELVSLLNNYNGEMPLTFYAFYTQGVREDWRLYAVKNFNGITNPKVTVINIWDPEGASSFHKNYSVLTTPSLFLINADNTIIGRKLDAEALATLLKTQNSFFHSLYTLMNELKEQLGFSHDAIQDICTAFAKRTEDDSRLYHDTFYGIFSYLRAQNDIEAQDGAAMVAEKYIIGQKEKWSSEFVQAVEQSVAMYRLNPVGSKASDVTLLDRKGKESMLSDFYGRKNTVVFFNLVSCADCKAFKESLQEMDSLLKHNGVRVLSVYVGPDEAEWQEDMQHRVRRWRYLRADWPEADIFMQYDLSIVPKIYLLDSDGIVTAKDITPTTLKEILQK